MQLEWLGKYRLLVEKIIKYGNIYSRTYRKNHLYGTDRVFSAAELQTLEYILENENEHQNMAEIASRLGVSRSTLSKNVKMMLDKGLLEKYHTYDNRKDIIIKPSEEGRHVYEQYCIFAQKDFFDKMFEILEDVPDEHIEKFMKVIDLLADNLIEDKEDEEKILIKIE